MRPGMPVQEMLLHQAVLKGIKNATHIRQSTVTLMVVNKHGQMGVYQDSGHFMGILLFHRPCMVLATLVAV